MGISQTQKAEKDIQALLPNNPFVPPQGGVCHINNLPPELLSRIFEVGADDEGDSEDEEETVYDWDDLCHSPLGKKHADDKEPDSDAEMAGESNDADAEMGSEEETDEESDATGCSDLSPPFQVVVSHVCRHWRNVALSTPSLWTTIMVTPEARPPYEPVSTLLDRSKGLPIDIYVDCEPEEGGWPGVVPELVAPSDDDLRFLFNLLIPHVHRWRTIEVTVSAYHHMFVFLSAVSHPSISAAPQLTTIELYHHDDAAEFENFAYPGFSKHLVLFGGSAPCLTKVVLWGVHIDWDQPWIASPSELVDLELSFHAEDVRPTWTQFATILRGASSLERLNLRMSGPSGDPSEWIIQPNPGSPADLNAPIHLPRATDFVLAFQSQARAIGLARKLALPRLKNLVLDFDNGDYTDFVDVLIGPATSVSAQEQPRSLLSILDTLKIAGLPCRPECVVLLYHELQNLTALNLSLVYLPQDFLDTLCMPRTVVRPGEVWLPRLTTLFIAGTSGDVLRDFVEKRRNIGAPLEGLYVEESCELDEEEEEWFRENLKTFELFEGSDDEDVPDFDDLHEDLDEWSDVE